MVNEMIRALPPENKKKPWSLSIQRTMKNTRNMNKTPEFLWKQIILDISQKQGYTGIAL